MKKIAFPFLLVLLLSACANPGASGAARLDDLTARVEQLELENARLETLTARVDQLEQELSAAGAGAETQPTPTVTPPADLAPDYSTYSHIEDLFPLLPADFTHPFPAEHIRKGILLQESHKKQVVLVYDQVISSQAVETMAANLNGELTDVEKALGGSPMWEVETPAVTYLVQKVEPDVWYDGFIESDVRSTAIYIDFRSPDSIDLSHWFDTMLFAYPDYQLPDTLANRTPKTTVVIVDHSNDQHPAVQSVSIWQDLTVDEMKGMYDHYTEILKDQEWFAFDGDPAQFASIYARLDQGRTITLKSMPGEGDEGRLSFRLYVSHFYAE